MQTVKNRKSKAGVRIINFRTLLFCAVFLCLGILFSYFRIVYGAPWRWLWLLLPVLSLVCLFTFTYAEWRRMLLSLGLLLISFSIGAVSFSAQVRDFTDNEKYNGEYTVQGRVISKQTDGDLYIVTIDGVIIDGKEEEGKLVAYLPSAFYDTLELSDKVLLCGRVRSSTEYFGKYGFRSYAIDGNTRYYMQAESGGRTGRAFQPFLAIRGRMEKVVYAGMDETPAAVTIATLMGDTSGVDEGLLENVRRGGIAHIFAVSGLHIGALYGFCLFLIGKKPLARTPKWLRFLFVAAILLFYGGVCGYSASVVRAIVTCLTFYFTKLTGLGHDILETIAFAVIVVLLLSPVALFTVGFQLSFAACFGIALLSRPLSKLFQRIGDWIKYNVFRKERKPFVLEEDTHPLTVGQRLARACLSFFSTCIAAQIATAPIQLSAFGYLSVWSLLFNCIFVPVIGAVFSLLLAFVLIACILPLSFSAVILYIPNTVWSLFLLFFEVVELSLTLTALRISAQATICYYTATAFCCGRWNMPKRLTSSLALVFSAAFVLIVALASG